MESGNIYGNDPEKYIKAARREKPKTENSDGQDELYIYRTVCMDIY